MTSPPTIQGLRDLERIGAGGFAEVFRAVEAPFDRVVAVKVLTARPGDAAAVTAFERECRALGQVDGHPHIVTVHSAGTTPDGRPYLVMGHEPGGSLQDRVDAGLRPHPAALAALGADLADALATAHRAGVLHRDVKPANVLLSASGVPKLTDFGIARLADETATGGRVTASLMHAPPEQLEGRPATAAGDAYSLGSTLATLSMGRPPFAGPEGEAEPNVLALLARVALDPPPDLRLHGQPAAMADLVGALLQKDPAARPQDLGQVAGHLRALADRWTGPAAAAHDPATGARAASAPPGPAHGGPGSAPPRRRLLVAGGIAAAVVVTSGVGALLLGRGAAPDGGAAASGPVPALADVPPVEVADGVDLGDPDVLASALVRLDDLPAAAWIETGNSRFTDSDAFEHPVALFDVCEARLDGSLLGAAAQRTYQAVDPDGGDIPIAVSTTASQVTGDPEDLEQQVADAYGACGSWDNSVAGGGSEETVVEAFEQIAVGPHEGQRSRIRFPGDGTVIEETRLLADGVWLTVQVVGDEVTPEDRDHVIAVVLTNLSRLG